MCLLNCNTKEKKYKHITYAERTMIETWYNCDKKSKREIAKLLHKSERTIRREINREKVIVRNYDGQKKKNIVHWWLNKNMNIIKLVKDLK